MYGGFGNWGLWLGSWIRVLGLGFLIDRVWRLWRGFVGVGALNIEEQPWEKTMQTKDFCFFVCDESVDRIGGVVILLMLLL